MAQGKLKVKTKVPTSKKTNNGKNKKGPQAQRRGNAPIKPKKVNAIESRKLKQMVTKSLNSAVEDELRDKALEGKKSLTKKNVNSTSRKS